MENAENNIVKQEKELVLIDNDQLEYILQEMSKLTDQEIIDIQNDEELCIIYKLTNTTNNKIYIGQTWLTFENRMGKTGEKYSNSPKLYNAIQKHGHEKFKYTILAASPDQDEVNDLEYSFMEYFQARDLEKGYNIKQGGRGGKHSEESKAKIAKSMTGRKTSDETRAKLSFSLKGKNKRPKTEEEKLTVSNSMKIWHANNQHPLLGKPRTDEEKKSISDGLKSVPFEMTPARQARIQRQKDATAFSPELEKSIIERYKAGITINKMSRELNVHNRQVRRVLVRNNIPLRTTSENAVLFNKGNFRKK